MAVWQIGLSEGLPHTMKPFTPQLYLVDYASWFVALVVAIAAPLPLVTTSEVAPSSALATGLISLTAIACVVVLLTRGRESRKLSKAIPRNKSEGVVFSLDIAQVQDAQARIVREIAPAAVVRGPTGRIELWQSSPTRVVLILEAEQIVSVESVHEFRRFCYPVLQITLNDSSSVRLRPVKQSGVQWRSGMTHREGEIAARQIWGCSLKSAVHGESPDFGAQ
ncbi:hypothetical protein ACI2IP_00650 [Microbacterium sp. NPDC090218]